jgi:hypothetical protein
MMNLSMTSINASDTPLSAANAAAQAKRVANAGGGNTNLVLSQAAPVFSVGSLSISQWNQLYPAANEGNEHIDSQALKEKLATLGSGVPPFTEQDFNALSPEEKDAYMNALARDISATVAAIETASDESNGGGGSEDVLRASARLLGDALLGPGGQYYAPAILMLLIRMFAEKRKVDLDNFSASLEQSKQMLNNMLTRMEDQIKNQRNASFASSIAEIAGGAMQVGLTGLSLGLSTPLIDKKRAELSKLSNLQKEGSQAATGAAKTADLSKKTDALANAINPTSTQEKSGLESLKKQTKSLEGSADTASQSADELSEKLQDPVITKTLEDQATREVNYLDDQLRKWQTVGQTAGALSSISQGIGNAAAAPLNADAQTANKDKEALDAQMNFAREYRQMQNTFADTNAEGARSAQQGYDQIQSTQAQSASGAARNSA